MIVQMKKAKIVVLKEDHERLMKSLQKYGEIMIIPQGENHEVTDTASEDAFILRTEKSLKFLKKFKEKKGMFADYSEVEYDEFVNYDPKRESLLREVEQSEEEISKLLGENDGLKEQIRFFNPWADLDIKLNEIVSSRYFKVHLGYIDPKNTEMIVEELTSFGCEYRLLGKASEGQALIFIVFSEEQNELLEKVKNQGFVEHNLPKEEKLVSDLIQEKQNLINENLQRINQINDNLKDLAKKINDIKILSDQMASLKELKASPITQTVETIYLEGWVRSDRIERFKKSIEEATDFYDLELSDPEENEVAPTVVKNNKFVAPFETVTEMYALPKQTDIDPNPFMAPWYLIIFGLMMADVGYGIIMLILFSVLLKVMKPKGSAKKLFKVLLYGSIPTIVWGFVFGSYFGETYNPILSPLDNVIEVLALTLVIGGLHIISGLLVRAYINFKNKDYFAIIFDQVSWIFVLVGVGLMFLPQFANYGQALALTGVIIIFLFAGRKSKNVFARLGSGLYALYNSTSYLSDILSYSRILALSLTTAIVGMVMNILAGLCIELIPIAGYLLAGLILIGGHIFNVAMGLLSAYVHDSRLQFIEFYNKFYEGGGEVFKPLSIKLNNVDEVIKTNLGGK